MKRLVCILLLTVSSMVFSPFLFAANELRVGILQYGTVNWEIQAIQERHLENAFNLSLSVVPLSSPQALLVALQGGKVDVILSDWLWVVRQKEMGRDYYFSPYSTNAGHLVVNNDAGIHALTDLKNKTLGVAGGRANKNWVLFRTYIKQTTGLVANQDYTVKFAAAPILNALMAQGELDGAINFWHYAAQLNAKGMPTLLTLQQLLANTGITQPVPMLGWVFSANFAQMHNATLKQFLAMSQEARKQLVRDDDLWQRLPAFQRYPNAAHDTLKTQYRQGAVVSTPADFSANMEAIYQRLKANQGSDNITGSFTHLPNDLLWSYEQH
ncbi:transporter substrate-binding domain-containing protein [Alteromonas sp. C1M14]|uniref:ABC transporter substrate-binding protein n=1 Tax=Alteromonas sp. C1M14 TaxID=2841567 RepID=UPI001C09A6DB|nr:transporter substrate-binding domain-containing protein [Alteromonas sp. C1M14]MBU2978150.1 transporter substrate-binding domain-containing protein [Alteromonas sp. C1M14]